MTSMVVHWCHTCLVLMWLYFPKKITVVARAVTDGEGLSKGRTISQTKLVEAFDGFKEASFTATDSLNLKQTDQ